MALKPAALGEYRKQSCAVALQLLRGAARAHLPGRVLLSSRPEWSPNVLLYKDSEFVRRNRAYMLGIRASMAVPIFDLATGESLKGTAGATILASRQSGRVKPSPDITGHGGQPTLQEAPYLHNGCVGVLEIASLAEDIFFMSVYGKAVRSALETEGFTYFSPDENERRYDPLDCTMMEERPPGATRNIITRLAETCKLPLIQVWEQDAECAMRTCRSPFAVGCGMGAAWAYRRVACEEAYSTQVAEVNMISEAFMTKSIIIEPDLTKTTLQQCPLKQLATMCGIGACVAFACDIFCSSSAVADSVGFKPKEEGQGCRRGGGAREAHTRVVIELFISTLPGRRAMTSAMLHPASIKLISSFMTLAATEGVSVELPVALKAAFEKHTPEQQHAAAVMLGLATDVPMGAVLGTAGARPSIAGASHGAAGVSASAKLTASEKTAGTQSTRSGGKRKVESKGVTVQMLQAHFCMSLKDAAASLGLCTTTLKRVCRSHGISRWPCRKLKKMNCLEGSLHRLHTEISGGPLNSGAPSASFGQPSVGAPAMSGVDAAVIQQQAAATQQAAAAAAAAAMAQQQLLSLQQTQQAEMYMGQAPVASAATPAAYGMNAGMLDASAAGAAVMAPGAGTLPHAMPDHYPLPNLDMQSVHGPAGGGVMASIAGAEMGAAGRGGEAWAGAAEQLPIGLVPAPEVVVADGGQPPQMLHGEGNFMPAVQFGVPQPGMPSVSAPTPHGSAALSPQFNLPTPYDEMLTSGGVLSPNVIFTPNDYGVGGGTEQAAMAQVVAQGAQAAADAPPPRGGKQGAMSVGGENSPPGGTATGVTPGSGPADGDHRAPTAPAAVHTGGDAHTGAVGGIAATNAPRGRGVAISETIGSIGDAGDAQLKVQYGDEMIRMRIPLAQADLGKIAERVSASIGCSASSLRLRYKDVEGDWIRLDTPNDFDELVAATREAMGPTVTGPLSIKLQVVQ